MLIWNFWPSRRPTKYSKQTYEQQKLGSACISAQADQCLWFSPYSRLMSAKYPSGHEKVSNGQGDDARWFSSSADASYIGRFWVASSTVRLPDRRRQFSSWGYNKIVLWKMNRSQMMSNIISYLEISWGQPLYG